MSLTARVVIVGCGPAGYAAACKLLEHGYSNITVLEAENRIGGRVNSVPFGNGIVDLGAQWCHGEKDNLVYEMVKDLNLVEHAICNIEIFHFVDSKSNFIDESITTPLMQLLFSISEDNEQLKVFEGSYGSFITQKYEEKLNSDFPNVDRVLAKQVLEVFHKLQNNLNASKNWFEISAKGITDYIVCEGDSMINWKNKGYKTIFSVLKKEIPDPSKKLPVDEKVLLNKEVNKIVWQGANKQNNKEILVECSDGSKYKADHVIVTVSLGVLKHLHNTLFVPELPLLKKNAIEGLSFGCVNKIILKFPRKWWPDCRNIDLLWREEDEKNIITEFPEGPNKDGKSWLTAFFSFLPIDYNPNILLGFVNGEFCKQIESISDDVIIRGCMYLLKKFVGKHYDIPNPDGMLREESSRQTIRNSKIHEVCSEQEFPLYNRIKNNNYIRGTFRTSWGTNNHFRGSYSFHGLEADRLNTSAAELAKPLGGDTLLFAGEATEPSFYSTVHGAIGTGFREAQRIISHHGAASLPKAHV